MADRVLPRLAGERPPEGFMLLPVDVFEFKCRFAGCNATQKQSSPVREFHVAAGKSVAPVDWWWCDACRGRHELRKPKTTSSGKKLAQAALNTPKINWPRLSGPPDA